MNKRSHFREEKKDGRPGKRKERAELQIGRGGLGTSQLIDCGKGVKDRGKKSIRDDSLPALALCTLVI